jgi:endonuclease III
LKRELLYREVLRLFREHNPDAATELLYGSPYELLVAVILSAQCTDVRVNMITPSFFESFPDPFALAVASHDAVFDKIRSCSYPNNKTKNLIGMAKVLAGEFHGIVPSDLESLQRLPGVGRKTANVIASVVFDKPAMAVDTHVFRVSARIGLTVNARNPLESEKQLVKYIPEEDIARAHHWLILHGRYVCKARKPDCSACFLAHLCNYYRQQQATDQIVDKK